MGILTRPKLMLPFRTTLMPSDTRMPESMDGVQVFTHGDPTGPIDGGRDWCRRCSSQLDRCHTIQCMRAFSNPTSWPTFSLSSHLCRSTSSRSAANSCSSLEPVAGPTCDSSIVRLQERLRSAFFRGRELLFGAAPSIVTSMRSRCVSLNRYAAVSGSTRIFSASRVKRAISPVRGSVSCITLHRISPRVQMPGRPPRHNRAPRDEVRAFMNFRCPKG